MSSALLQYMSYKEKLNKSVCLDIEMAEYDGAISIIGIYKPSEGIVNDFYNPLIKGKNLSAENLRNVLKDIKLIITFNGISHDIKKIMKEFPYCIPKGCEIMDLYQMAKELDYKSGLKVLEETFNIKRLEGYDKERDRPIYLWKKYFLGKDENSLNILLEYNKQDCVNLYMLSEEFMKVIDERLNNMSFKV